MRNAFQNFKVKVQTSDSKNQKQGTAILCRKTHLERADKQVTVYVDQIDNLNSCSTLKSFKMETFVP